MAFTSCIEHHVSIVLNKDGSGTITEETTIGAEAVAMMQQMSAMGGAEAGDPLADMVDEAKAKAKAAGMGEGVTLSKVEKVDANGRQGGRVVYAFKDINTVKYRFGDAVTEMGDGMKPPGADDGGDQSDQPITFSYKDGVLTLANPNVEEKAEADTATNGAEELDEQSLMMAKQMMGDMKMTMKLELPGGIEKTNASYVDGNTVTFMEMDMGKLLEDPAKFKAFAAAKPESPAEMQKALKGIDGVKIEANKEVSITLK